MINIANSFNHGPCIPELPHRPDLNGRRGSSYSNAQKFCETASKNGKTGRLFEPRTKSLNDKAHCFFTRLNLKRWALSNFAFRHC